MLSLRLHTSFARLPDCQLVEDRLLGVEEQLLGLHVNNILSLKTPGEGWGRGGANANHVPPGGWLDLESVCRKRAVAFQGASTQVLLFTQILSREGGALQHLASARLPGPRGHIVAWRDNCKLNLILNWRGWEGGLGMRTPTSHLPEILKKWHTERAGSCCHGDHALQEG